MNKRSTIRQIAKASALALAAAAYPFCRAPATFHTAERIFCGCFGHRPTLTLACDSRWVNCEKWKRLLLKGFQNLHAVIAMFFKYSISLCTHHCD